MVLVGAPANTLSILAHRGVKIVVHVAQGGIQCPKNVLEKQIRTTYAMAQFQWENSFDEIQRWPLFLSGNQSVPNKQILTSCWSSVRFTLLFIVRVVSRFIHCVNTF